MTALDRCSRIGGKGFGRSRRCAPRSTMPRRAPLRRRRVGRGSARAVAVPVRETARPRSATDRRNHGERRIEDVLLGEHAGGEALFRVARQHRHGRLRDDRAGIEFRHHEMHRAAVEQHAVRERPLVGVGAPEERQQGRVDVEHPAAPSARRTTACSTRMKPARQTSSMPRVAQRPSSAALEALPVRRRPCGRRRQPSMPGLRAPARARRRRAGSRATSAISAGIVRRARGLDQRDHVGAAAGDQDGDASASSSERQACRWSATRSPPACGDDLADAGPALSPACAQRSRPPRRPRSGAATTIMPMPQLKVRSISASATPPVSREPAENRRHRNRAEIEPRRRCRPAGRGGCCRESRRR